MSLRRLLGRWGRQEREFNSGIPLELPAKMAKPETLESMIKRYIREGELQKAIGATDAESFDEADDFEEEDPDTIPLTHHQVIAMDDSELREHAQHYGIEISDEVLEGSPGEMATTDEVPVAGPSGGLEGEKTS